MTPTHVEVNQKILFDTDADSPRPESLAVVSEVARVVSGHQEIRELVVEGHTDNTGKPDKNQNLSERRARKVRDLIVARVERDTLQIKATGFGQNSPIADNDSKAGRAQNRRVVFRVTKRSEAAEGAAKNPVQRRVRRGERAVDGGTSAAAAQRGLGGVGDTFPHLPRIQAAFGGYDLASLRAHLDARAIQAARELRAEAYTSGEHVAFAKAPDLHTAAHEAAHVIQQRAGVSLEGGLGQEGDRYERHADQVADAVVAGRSAVPVLAQMAKTEAGAGTDAGRTAARGGGGRAIQRVANEASPESGAEKQEAAIGAGNAVTADEIVGRIALAESAALSNREAEALVSLDEAISWLEARSATSHIAKRFGVAGAQTAQFFVGALLGDLKAIRATLRRGAKPAGLWTSVRRRAAASRTLLSRLNDEPGREGDKSEELAALDRGFGSVVDCVALGVAVGGTAFIGIEVLTFIGANYLRAELTQLVVLRPELVTSGVVLVLEVASVGLVTWLSRFKTWEGALGAVKGLMELRMMVDNGRGGVAPVSVRAPIVGRTQKGLKVEISGSALPLAKGAAAGSKDGGEPAAGGRGGKKPGPRAEAGDDGDVPNTSSSGHENATGTGSRGAGGKAVPGHREAGPEKGASSHDHGDMLKASGQTREAFQAAQDVCDKFNVIIEFRPTSKYARPHIEKGAAAKPEDVKMKTINDADVALGAKQSRRGTVGYGKKRLPKNFHRLEKENPKWAAQLRDRLRERRAEDRALGKDLKALEKKGDFRFRKRQLIDEREGATRGKPVAGDNDLFAIKNADGSPVTDKALYDAVMQALRESASNVQHPDVMSWKTKKAKDAKMKAGLIKRHQKGGEMLIQFKPGGKVSQVFADDDAK